MSDLIAFLDARLKEDRAAAFTAGRVGTLDEAHEARLLREVEAGRAILDLHREVPAHDIDWSSCAECRTQTYPCGTLRRIASVYSDHPGYQAEWKP